MKGITYSLGISIKHSLYGPLALSIWDTLLDDLDKAVVVSMVEDHTIPRAMYPHFEFRKTVSNPRSSGWVWARRELHWNILWSLVTAYIPGPGPDMGSVRGWDNMQSHLDHATTLPHQAWPEPDLVEYQQMMLQRCQQDGNGGYPWATGRHE